MTDLTDQEHLSRALQQPPSRHAWREIKRCFDALDADLRGTIMQEVDAALDTWPDAMREVELYLSGDEDDERSCFELGHLSLARHLIVNAGSRRPKVIEAHPEAFAHLTQATFGDSYCYHERAPFLADLVGLECVVVARPTQLTSLSELAALPRLRRLALTNYCGMYPDSGGLDWIQDLEHLDELVIFDHILEPGCTWQLPPEVMRRLRTLWLPYSAFLAQSHEQLTALHTLTISDMNEIEELARASPDDVASHEEELDRFRDVFSTLSAMSLERVRVDADLREEHEHGRQLAHLLGANLPASVRCDISWKDGFSELWQQMFPDVSGG